MTIDRQRIAGVETLERMGYRWSGTEWTAPAAPGAEPSELIAAADAMHGVLMDRAEALAGCIEDGTGEAELEAVGEALEAYEAARWPTGRTEPPRR